MASKPWLLPATLLLVLAPFFFNCQRSADLSVLAPHSNHNERAPASIDTSQAEGSATLSPSSAGAPKVQIPVSALVAGTGAGPGGAQSKAADGATGLAVPAGQRIAATVDNDCLAARQASGSRKTGPPQLSDDVVTASRSAKLAGTHRQAYAFTLMADQPLDELIARAEADPCTLHVTTDERIQLALPPPTEVARRIDSPTASTREKTAFGEASTQSATSPLAATEPTAMIAGSSNDPGLGTQAHLAAINAAQGWDVFYSQSLGITADTVVAVVDTGVDYTHEDLAANMWQDANGYHGIDFENSTSTHTDFDPMDDQGHGTHVAGLIGAVRNNGIGVSGIAGTHVKLMAVKVADASGAAYPSSIVNGIVWAVDHGAEVINVSIGLAGTNSALRDAVGYATSRGAFVALAASNEGKLIQSSATGANFVSPAGYAVEFPGAIAVASIDAQTGLLSSFSNYSTFYIYMSAPGSYTRTSSSDPRSIYSTYWSAQGARYAGMQGTSMASPIVSGAAALTIGYMKSRGATPTPAKVAELLTGSARINSNLTNFVKNGATLDLERLGRALLLRYGVESAGGTENPF